MARESSVCKEKIYRYGLLIIPILILSLLLGCGENKKVKQAKHKPKIGLMITPEGLNDKGFNDSAYDGLKEAEKLYGVIGTIIEPATMKDPEASLRFFAAQKFDAIIAVGGAFVSAIKEISKEQPDLQFYIIDSDIEEGNIHGVSFRDDEGSYLCGYIAAKLASTKKIGFIGGMKIPVIERFLNGYVNGAKSAVPDIDIVTEYVAKRYSGFNRPNEANKIALEMYRNGCGVIFPPAGASALGVISAAVKVQKYVIGIDMNQDSLAPGLVLTSMLKRVDIVVEDIAKNVSQNNLKKIKRTYGLADNAISLTDFQLSYKVVGEKLIKKIAFLKKQIIEGKIKTSSK